MSVIAGYMAGKEKKKNQLFKLKDTVVTNTKGGNWL